MGDERLRRRSVLSLSALLAALAALFVLRTEPTVLFEGTGAFGAVRVIERSDGLRELYAGAGRARQSAVYPNDPRHLELAYSRTAMIGPALVGPDARILFVGLGGGAMPTFVRQIVPDARLDVVEIDPLIVRAAADWFGVRADSAMVVHTGDGRAFIEGSPPERWDLVVLDAFSDTDIPRALTTRPFLEAVRRSLDSQGIVVSNLHTSAPEYEAMVATYLEVFPTVLLVPVSGRRQNILIATDRVGLDAEAVIAAGREWSARVEPGFDLGGLTEGTRVARAAPGAAILEDAGDGPP